MLILTKSITFAFNIVSGAFSFNPAVPPMYRVLLSVPAVVLSACMACRAHRIMFAVFDRGNSTAPMLSAFVASANNSGSGHTIVAVEKGIFQPN